MGCRVFGSEVTECLISLTFPQVVSLVQTLIFSWVLLETYLSYHSAISSSVTDNTTSESSSESYYFTSATCPIGFLPVTMKTIPGNDSTDDDDDDFDSDADEEEAASTVLTVMDNVSLSSTSLLTFEDDMIVLASPMSSLSPSSEASPVLGNEEGIVVLEASSSSAAPAGVENATSLLSSPSRASTYSMPSAVPNTFKRAPRITCAAPGQGVLWALVVVSALYSVVGGLLIVAVLWCVSWQLSIWFFYTVFYDLFMLIVAMTDGVYTSFSDISSYVVCLVTTYCVIVVDSYYEKVLQDERLDKSGQARRRSSLVIVRSSPDSPTRQQEYIPPTTYTLPTNHNSLAPPPVTLGPPPLTRQISFQLPASPSREAPPIHLKHAYHNNV
nr:uncharacterized protein LOC123764231 [Procambarus clarkii]